LVIKAFVNYRQIDEVHIQNVTKDGLANPDGTAEYVIREPKGYDEFVFTHNRSEGWMPLASDVLNFLGECGDENGRKI